MDLNSWRYMVPEFNSIFFQGWASKDKALAIQCEYQNSILQTASFGYLVCGLVCMGMHNSFVEAREESQIGILMWVLVTGSAASTSLDSTWVSWALFVSTCRLPVQILHYRCVDLSLANWAVQRAFQRILSLLFYKLLKRMISGKGVRLMCISFFIIQVSDV